MSLNPFQTVRRRVLLVTCGIASALSGLAVATDPSVSRLSQAAAVATEEAGAQGVGTGGEDLQVDLAADRLRPASEGPERASNEAVQAGPDTVGPTTAERGDRAVRPGLGARPVAATGGDARVADDRLALGPVEVSVPAVGALQRSPAARGNYRIVWMEVTAYCACTHCCGPNAQGLTASGRPVSYNRGRFVAADTRLLPFYTQLSIPGYHGGEPVPVLDRGGAIKGNKLDVYFDSHETARQWGRRWLPVRVYEPRG